MDNFEVITTIDKDARNRMFEDFRKNGNEFEKQAVKFSSVKQMFEYDVEPVGEKKVLRMYYVSEYSVAYPRG